MERATQPAPTSLDDMLAGGGEMGALMRSLDWSRTPIGPAEGWPQSLRTAVSICLSSRFPILIWWGPALVMLYNDAYRPMLGDKHPRSMGAPGRAVWPEIWHIIGPMLDSVRHDGKATWSDDEMLPLERNGYAEECYFTFSYSPIRDETGGVGGVFCAVTETTARVIGERRLRALRELASQSAEARTTEAACALAAQALAAHPEDIPFALLYLVENGGNQARLTQAIGIPPATDASPTTVDLVEASEAGEAGGWPLAAVARSGEARIVRDVSARFGPLAADSVAGPPHTALVLPVAQAGQDQPAALLVVGISPRRALDDEYHGFFDLVASHIATAITDARAYEEERRRAEALAELDRAKTVFFSNVSHEFRTPLTLLLGPLQDALTDARQPLRPNQRERVQVAHRNALRLLKLVNTLLDFSRIEAGRTEAVYEPTDLPTYTAELASVFRSAVERAGLRFVVECPPLPSAFAPIYVDREMWEKIVLNLLSNALKFTFAGEIVVALRPATGGAVELHVRDTGVGIPTDELPHLFERFHRARGTYGRTQEGTGIGLALVRELARLHGGSVAVTSEPGSGSEFVVSIPVGAAHLPADHIGAERSLASTALGAVPYIAEAQRWMPDGVDARPAAARTGADHAGQEDGFAPAEARGEALGTSGATEPARILLADDNADMREYLRRLLAERYAVLPVGDGAAALAAAQENSPDLVLADVMMPGLDGFELLRALRDDPRTRAVPVILLSARAGEEATTEGLRAGADDYLVKPFSAREVLARVAARLEMARLRREALRSEARFRAVADSAPVMIWMSGTDTHYTYFNQRWLDFTGRTFERESGNGWTEGVPADDLDRRLEVYTAAFAVRQPFSVEYRLRRHDGEYRWVLDNGVPLFAPDGAFTGYIGSCVDITERKRLDRQKDEFLGIASHELRTPLTSLSANIQMAERQLGALAEGDAGIPEPARGKLARAHTLIERTERQMARLDRLVGDLLDVSRIQAGKLGLRPLPCDLLAIVRETVEAQRAAWPERRIDVELPQRSQVMLLADADRIEQAITNFLTNALKYSPMDQPVDVRVALDGSESVRVEVRDRGPGLPADERERIWEQFYRAADVEVRSGSGVGLGLGLHISKTIVERHGGQVGVESAPGHGATFWCTLPLPAGSEGAESPANGGGYTSAAHAE